MTAPMVASSHRALTSNAGDAARYAEQLLHRICRRWGMTVTEVKHFNGKGGRTQRARGDTIMRSAVIADWLRELDAAGGICTNGIHERGGNAVVSSVTLAILLNTSDRTVRRYLAALRRYQDRRQQNPGAAATGQALVKGVTVAACQEKSVDARVSQDALVVTHTDQFGKEHLARFTGYDRASFEELIAGGGQ